MPLKYILVVGAGGNGSVFLTHLCRIHQAWTRLGGEPFKVKIVDPDMVTEANLARQVFCQPDVGQPKAAVLAQRMSAFFGINVEYHVGPFLTRTPYGEQADIIVGCVDNLGARRQMEQAVKPSKWTRRQWSENSEHEMAGCYWLDLGNSDTSGQVVLGGHGLPNLFDVLPQLRKAKDPKDLPSCSMAEALSRQDLFINSTLATLAGNLLWQMMRHGRISHHGYFVNLRSGRVQPIQCPLPPTKPATPQSKAS